ncbi:MULTISPECIES: DUF2163 domain-containing protein [unclassified Iodidimonas]|jgi:uncharacterized phage protein (TIGR02218 family)|uniref:DUF2163 domain-containing protein n=1 Tax=unclassified Iodidimonas TaxID=2626145 RepID=UPI002482ABF2|nr:MULTISPECIES: DUF2163 domain-containing protein [unclassified Iodidimonas]
MRAITQAFARHLAEDVTSLALCWRLQRRDGVMLALTSHDRDLRVDGLIYRADGGLSASAARETADLAIDNLEIDGVLMSRSLLAEDLSSGRFDDARIWVFLVNWMDPDAGSLLIKRGSLGRITRIDDRFQAEMRGMTHGLSAVMTESYSPGCRAELGDRRCKKSLNAFTETAGLTAIMNETTFRGSFGPKPARWYDFGKIRWHTGKNGGLISEVRSHQGDQINLLQAPPQPMAVGDIFTIIAGCDKTLAICRDKFDNIINFRGDPFVPGTDALLDYPGLL